MILKYHYKNDNVIFEDVEEMPITHYIENIESEIANGNHFIIHKNIAYNVNDLEYIELINEQEGY